MAWNATEADTREIVIGTATTAMLKVISISCQYAFLLYLSLVHGAESVGVYNIFLSLVVIAATIATLGFNQAILRSSAQYGLQGNWGALQWLYRRMSSISIIAAALLGVLLLAGSPVLQQWLFRGSAPPWITYALPIAMPAYAAIMINADTIRGLKQIAVSEYFRTVSVPLWNLIVLMGLLAVVAYSPGVPIISYTVALVLTACISALSVRRRIRISPDTAGRCDEEALRDELKGAMPLFAILVSTMIMEYGGILIMGYYRGAEEVGIYSVAFRVSMIVGYVLAAVNSIVAPKFAELYWGKMHGELQRIVRYSSKLLLFTTSPILLVLMIYPEGMLRLFGAEFAAGADVLRILCLGNFVNAVSGSAGYFLIMTGSQREFRDIMLLSAAVFLALSSLLVPAFGGKGAALAVSIAMLLWNVLSVTVVRKKYEITTYYNPFRS